MCGALNTRRGRLRAMTSRRGRSGRLVAHDCLVVLPLPRLVVVSPSVTLPPTILPAPAPPVIRRLSCCVDVISLHRPSCCHLVFCLTPCHRRLIISSSLSCRPPLTPTGCCVSFYHAAANHPPAPAAGAGTTRHPAPVVSGLLLIFFSSE
jgi:hypothetical protein